MAITLSFTAEQAYTQIIKSYDDSEETLFEKSSLDKKGLNEIIDHALSIFTKTPFATFTHRRIPYYAALQNNTFYLWKVEKLLDQSKYSQILMLFAIHSATKNILKLSTPHPPSLEWQKNEHAIIQAINPKGEVLGIARLPFKFPSYTALGLISQFYNQFDYKKVIEARVDEPFSLELLLLETIQIVYGLKYLADRGIIHGDMKPANIFYELVDGIPHLMIADFAGAHKMGEKGPSVFPQSRKHRLKEDEEAIKGLEEGCIEGFVRKLYIRELNTLNACPGRKLKTKKRDLDQKIKACELKIKEHAEEIKLKSDVYGMGSILFKAFANTLPYELDEENRPDILRKTGFSSLSEKAPKELTLLIAQTVAGRYYERPSAPELFWQFYRFIKEIFLPTASDDFRRKFSLLESRMEDFDCCDTFPPSPFSVYSLFSNQSMLQTL